MSTEPKKSYADLLSDERKGVGEPKGVTGILSNLWRTICFVENITPTKWYRAQNRWVDKIVETARKAGVTIKRSSVVGNLDKEAKDNKMTIKVLFKLLRIYGATKVDVKLVVTWGNGKVGEYEYGTSEVMSDDEE